MLADHGRQDHERHRRGLEHRLEAPVALPHVLLGARPLDEHRSLARADVGDAQFAFAGPARLVEVHRQRAEHLAVAPDQRRRMHRAKAFAARKVAMPRKARIGLGVLDHHAGFFQAGLATGQFTDLDLAHRLECAWTETCARGGDEHSRAGSRTEIIPSDAPCMRTKVARISLSCSW